MSAAGDKRTVAVVTGTRAEFGLLRSTMTAIRRRDDLHLQVLVTGTHLLPPARTIDEVAAAFQIDATIPMQLPDEPHDRLTDAIALGRGITGFAQHFARQQPDVVLVLGDRIEAFAAAAAAAIAGIRVAHMHGGDRAEGIADESLRHAITKLAHIHLPATPTSAQRIIAMGEEPSRVHVIGSPAVDGLHEIAPLADDAYAELGQPEIIMLLHPVGDDPEVEYQRANALLHAAQRAGRVLALYPNHDPGRAGIVRAIQEAQCESRQHVPREQFIALLKRARIIAGNSSAGLIECAALGVRCVNVGRRQSGREMPANVIDVPEWDAKAIANAIDRAMTAPASAASCEHPYGDGAAGERAAALLATFDLQQHAVTKKNTY